MNPEHRLGWLGTGRMGAAMATRLLDAGVGLTVWNRTAAKAEALRARGAAQVGTVAELGDCDIVFITVTSSADLLAVTVGPDGVLSGDQVPRIVVDCSTVAAEAAAEVRAAADDRGSAFLSAPISGNPAMVAEGAAAIVASGPADVFATAEPYLQTIAPTTVHCGYGEESRLVKLCHNLLLGLLAEALAEVVTVAEKGGVDPGAFLDFINGSVLGSTWILHKGNAIRARDYTPTFTSENLRKDFDLGLAAARALEVPVPLVASTHQLVQTAINTGFRDADYITLYEVAARAAGLVREGQQS
jgi:3-hydroxyisobutyrate dehydrogenase-like beta-hydroxyacid dehydrogenase